MTDQITKANEILARHGLDLYSVAKAIEVRKHEGVVNPPLPSTMEEAQANVEKARSQRIEFFNVEV